MEKRYTIKDIANLLNVSKDTLRFYERKGIIKPIKGQNGYRYYTNDHIWTLLDIIFYRRINFSINEIDEIVNHSTRQSITKMTQEKIIEEARQVKLHQQALLKLQLANESYLRIENHLDRYTILPMAKQYIIAHRYHTDAQAYGGWFQSMNERKNFEFCYTYEKYTISSTDVCQNDAVNEREQTQLAELFLTISADTAHLLDLEEDFVTPHCLCFPACVYTVIESDIRSPRAAAILQAANWARSQGYCLQNTAYSDYLVSCCENHVTTYYLELYLPLISSTIL